MDSELTLPVRFDTSDGFSPWERAVCWSDRVLPAVAAVGTAAGALCCLRSLEYRRITTVRRLGFHTPLKQSRPLSLDGGRCLRITSLGVFITDVRTANTKQLGPSPSRRPWEEWGAEKGLLYGSGLYYETIYCCRLAPPPSRPRSNNGCCWHRNILHK